MPKTLEDVIADVCIIAAEAGWDGEEWHGDCFEACIAFQEALFDAGLITEDGRETEWDLENLSHPSYVVKHPVLTPCDHWVFRLGQTYYDWALPQFGIRDVTYPLVWRQ